LDYQKYINPDDEDLFAYLSVVEKRMAFAWRPSELDDAHQYEIK
jgi:hypothetical protein